MCPDIVRFDHALECVGRPPDRPSGLSAGFHEPGLLHQARAEHRIDLKSSYVVGDKDADMLLARSVGAKGILVRTGKDAFSPHADSVVDDLSGAVAYILGRSDA